MFDFRVWLMFGGLIFNTCASMETESKKPSGWCENLDNDTYPEEDGVTKDCNITVHPSDQKNFAHAIAESHFKLNFWTFTLKFENDGSGWNNTLCAFQPLNWIWTYPGEKGAVVQLSWPDSYKVWSLGILSVDSQFIANQIRLIVHGNCPVIIGQMNTTERIGLALIQMANNSDLIKKSPEIEYSYFCYTEQIWIDNILLYNMCQHIVCPIRAFARKCCRTIYEYETRRKRVVCSSKPILYSNIWWQYPFIIGIIMFAYFPLLLLKCVAKICLKESENLFNYGTTENVSNLNKIPEEFLVENPVSVWNVLKRPIMSINSSHSCVCSVILKVCVVLGSLSIISIEILTSYFFEYEFIVEGVKHGIPMNFVSIIAPVNDNKGEQFLFYFGGPYVALLVYIASFSLLLCIPKRFSKIIENGITDNSGLAISLLTLDLKTKGKMGGIYNIQMLSGYEKFFYFLKTHIFMLINTRFWILGLNLQFQRFKGLGIFVRTKSALLCIGVIVAFPFYVMVCFFEWAVIVTYYLIPVIPFYFTIICGFWNSLRLNLRMTIVSKAILFPFIAFGMTFNIYIFSIIFIESFLFISRIFVFTLTGLITFPNETYGHIVLSITITMYVVETTHSVRVMYDEIFRRLQSICNSINKNHPNVCLVLPYKGSSLLSKDMFYYVINRLRPIRINICLSCVKIILMTFVFYLAIAIISSIERFQKMESLTQVVTVMFICLVPKLWKRMCHLENKLKTIDEQRKISTIVEEYCRQKLFSITTVKLECGAETFQSSEILNPEERSLDDSGDELLFDQT